MFPNPPDQPTNKCPECKSPIWDHRAWCKDTEHRLSSDPEVCASCKRLKKTGDATQRCRCGRPGTVTPDKLAMLEEAYAYGATDAEACLHAGVTKGALDYYQEKFPEFKTRKEELRETPNFTARKTLIDALKTDPDLALKYLERKKADEFAPTNKVKNTIEIELHQIHGELIGEQKSLVDSHVIEGVVVPPELPASV